jgi:tRNA threonylcarbamoyl adenosine modification protein (Sua5/YciO/YrdC/YwlC family)
MLIEIHPKNPDNRKIKQVIECLQDGGVIIYPTDSVYGLGCLLNQSQAVEKIARLKGIKVEKANFSILVKDLSELSNYCKPIDTPIFKLLKRNLPGPFTFILNANSNVPKIFKNNKKTIGIRWPDNAICQEILKITPFPLINASIHADDEVIDYLSDPYEIHEKYEKLVDIVIDGGFGEVFGSTVVDCTNGYPELIRQGLGELID